jgi:asparagine synthase (glutamine-hydrolysing)
MGIIPLYDCWDEHGTFMWPELKALEGYCTKIQLFPPGHYMTSKDGEFVQWYKRDGLIMMP